MFLNSAKRIWDHVAQLYTKSKDSRISRLKQHLAMFKQGDLSVTSYYYNAWMTAWEELAFYQPIPVCTCAMTCRCGIYEELVAQREKDSISRLGGCRMVNVTDKVRVQELLTPSFLGYIRVVPSLRLHYRSHFG